MKWSKQYEYIMSRQTTRKQRFIHRKLKEYGLDPGKSSRKHEYIIYKYVKSLI